MRGNSVMGKLVYVMGPSGAGKDTLLRHAREHLNPQRVVFAQRHITRPLSQETATGDERHIPLSEREFDTKRKQGEFAMHWQSHGLQYGISSAINDDLLQGRTVVVNGSRTYLPKALHRYPHMLPVLISARPDILRARLHARGRESGAELEERIEGGALTVDVPCAYVDNSGPLEPALEKLLTLIQYCEHE